MGRKREKMEPGRAPSPKRAEQSDRCDDSHRYHCDQRGCSERNEAGSMMEETEPTQRVQWPILQMRQQIASKRPAVSVVPRE